jgi:hypothetical protein
LRTTDPAYIRGMATTLYFASGRELAVPQSEDDVALAVRRDHPNPVRLGDADSGEVHVNWDHIDFMSESSPQQPSPV